MSGQTLDEATLAKDPLDPLSKPMSSLGPVLSMVSLTQGTKRKASSMENVELPQGASQMYPPIKVEPSSPNHFAYRGIHMGDTHPELHEKPLGYVGSSSSDDTDDQLLDIDEDEGTATTGPFSTPRAAGVRLNVSSRDISIPLGQELNVHTAKVVFQNDYKKTNSLLHPLPMINNSPPSGRQKASGRTENSGCHTGNKPGDVDYNSIPDYAPPTSTLPKGNPHSLQVYWREKPLVDHSNDPDRHMLHEAELELVTTLNLSCAKYLSTKRRIFQAHLKALQAGREFKKTDFQKACKINANKASKICGAFEKVGWFDKKYFLEYLKESNNPLKNASNENKHNGSPSSRPTNPDIWDVSESECYFTSEGDEDSSGDDTADSSVTSDGRHDHSEGRRNLDSYRDSSSWQQNRGLSLTGGDGSQRRSLIDGTVQTHDVRSGDEAVDEGPMIEDERSRRGGLLEETMYSRTSEGLPGDDTEEVPMLETRSMTQKIRLALNSHSGDKYDKFSTIKSKNSQQESNLEKPHRRVASIPIPHFLDEANAADTVLVKMKEKGRSWREIEEAWEKKTGKAQSAWALSRRYSRIMANLASTGLKPDKELDSGCSPTHLRLETDDDQRLLAAESEIEERFQSEKSDIIAEMESNFRSEKWNLVAEAMSRTGSARYSGQLIQAQYERLTRDSDRADAKDKDNNDTVTDLPRRRTRTIKGGRTETSTPPRSVVRRPDEASDVTSLPQPQHARLFLYQKRPDSTSQATKTTSGQKSPADRAAAGQQTVRKDKLQFCAEQSVRSLRAWAKRRALGTNGRGGGPPKAKKAKTAIPTSNATPDIGMPKQTAHRVIEEEVRRDANQHKQSLAQIIPAAPQTGSGQKPIKPSTKLGAKRKTCRSCGMSYTHDSEHYRVLPNIGSEHRRRLAANQAAAESHSGPSITDVRVENTTDISMGEMIFENSSKEQSPELSLPREDRQLLGEVTN